jgi:hypothetical protein
LISENGTFYLSDTGMIVVRAAAGKTECPFLAQD